MSNTFGELFRVTTWGESHGVAVGAVVDGVPAGLELSEALIQEDLDQRRASQFFSTPRQEEDRVQILSGVYEGLTLGTPIMLFVPNKQARSADYRGWENLYRPSHGDYTWEMKYGHRDPRGGGRSSARETVGRVAAGAVARQLLRVACGVEVVAWVQAVGGVQAHVDSAQVRAEQVREQALRCPDAEACAVMEKQLQDAAASGDSLGGVIALSARGVPAGWGEPVFGKVSAKLAQAMLSIPACQGMELGAGFTAASRRGSQNNDEFCLMQGKITTRTNNSGGIQGGISNGAEIFLRLAFKPVPSIAQPQRTVNRQGEEVSYAFTGRHDVCFLPRAVAIVEAMAALVLADCFLLDRAGRTNLAGRTDHWGCPDMSEHVNKSEYVNMS